MQSVVPDLEPILTDKLSDSILEFDNSLFRIVMNSILSDCNSFPRFIQSFLSDCNSFPSFRSLNLHILSLGLQFFPFISWIAIRSLDLHNPFSRIAIRSLDLHNPFSRIAIRSLHSSDCNSFLSFLGLQFGNSFHWFTQSFLSDLHLSDCNSYPSILGLQFVPLIYKIRFLWPSIWIVRHLGLLIISSLAGMHFN